MRRYSMWPCVHFNRGRGPSRALCDGKSFVPLLSRASVVVKDLRLRFQPCERATCCFPHRSWDLYKTNLTAERADQKPEPCIPTFWRRGKSATQMVSWRSEARLLKWNVRGIVVRIMTPQRFWLHITLPVCAILTTTVNLVGYCHPPSPCKEMYAK